MKENLHIFYCPNAKNAQEGQVVFLDEEEAEHCSRVLRLKTSDEITLIDGFGAMYTAQITECHKKNVSVKIIEKNEDAFCRNYFNHVAIAPTKNIDRFEWFIEKAVEFGIDEITPLLCAHSERKVIKDERLSKIVISAVKQSGNTILPVLNGMTSFSDFVENVDADKKLIAHCESGMERVFFGDCVEKNQKIVTLIGPEGDFSPEEILLAQKHGFQAVTLGNTRLRTETAGVSVCAFLSCINNLK
ncbi:MAG: 16S rRNA (uracil(1498)-N(3))-methyltransferase [Bacteroidales bacterium]|nr:16S rRNA (uracil(1498)-N(3))-methyltransferase [Bacteroidales bacterium]